MMDVSVSQVLSISLGLALLTLTNLREQSQSKNINKQIWVLSLGLVPNLLNLLIIGMSCCTCCLTVLPIEDSLHRLLTRAKSNLCCAEPATTAAMYDRHKLEKTVEKDTASQDALKSKPEYKRLSKRFGMLHGLSSSANLLTVGAAHVHLWYLAAVLNRL